MDFLTSLFGCFNTTINWFVDSPVLVPFMASVVLIGSAGIILKIFSVDE